MRQVISLLVISINLRNFHADAVLEAVKEENSNARRQRHSVVEKFSPFAPDKMSTGFSHKIVHRYTKVSLSSEVLKNNREMFSSFFLHPTHDNILDADKAGQA